MLNRCHRALAAAAAALLLPAGALAASPVVVELFTSQGCSSCPPAEAFLSDLARRPDIVALEFHVDYWDYIGWQDPFAERSHTERQHAYAESLDGRMPYTPQMVVNGRVYEVGSRREAVEALIQAALEKDAGGPQVALVMRGDKEVEVQVGAAVDAGEGSAVPAPHDIYFASFDRPHRTEIRRGENRGRILTNTNVVRTFERIGEWRGEPLALVVPLSDRAGDGGCAVILQAPGTGPIVAGAILAFSPARQPTPVRPRSPSP